MVVGKRKKKMFNLCLMLHFFNLSSCSRNEALKSHKNQIEIELKGS